MNENFTLSEEKHQLVNDNFSKIKGMIRNRLRYKWSQNVLEVTDIASSFVFEAARNYDKNKTSQSFVDFCVYRCCLLINNYYSRIIKNKINMKTINLLEENERYICVNRNMTTYGKFCEVDWEDTKRGILSDLNKSFPDKSDWIYRKIITDLLLPNASNECHKTPAQLSRELGVSESLISVRLKDIRLKDFIRKFIDVENR